MWRLILAAALLVGPGLGTVRAQEPDVERGVLLVQTDRDLDELFVKAREAVSAGASIKAVELLQSLITGEKNLFYPNPDDPRRFISPARAATALLATLPPDALAHYGTLYDAPAQTLLEQARANGNEQLLRQIVTTYFQTMAGETALDLLGTLAFDQGAYLEAAHAWETLYREHRRGRLDRAMLLAQATVAYHLAGAAPLAAELRANLQTRYPKAVGTIAGEQVVLSAFLDRVLATSVPMAPAKPRPITSCPSLAGSPDAVAAMADCEASWQTHWTQRPADQLARVREMIGGAATSFQPELQGGRVQLSSTTPGYGTRTFTLPALVHPVIVPGAVICRWENEVVAYAPDTGKELWRTSGLPMYRVDAGATRTENPYLPLAGDMGRHALSEGGGNIYTVCRFRRVEPETYRKFVADDVPDSSSLVALSLAGKGKTIAWEIGNGKGNTELLQQAKYLTAPTYAGGRLYVLAKVGQVYRALCLDAQNGALVWDTGIGPIPSSTGEAVTWQAAFTTELLTERASPAAVCDGRVFFTTNAGLVFALSADNGQPLWSYRYDSRIVGPASARQARTVEDLAYLLIALSRPIEPINPLVIANGHLVCLPTDSDDVLALDALTGAMLWQTPAQGRRDLTAVANDRFLLSGAGLAVARTRDGAILKTLPATIVGRPLVTPSAVLAAEPGQVMRLDLDSLDVERQPVTDPAGMLGRLFSVDGRLLAVNAAGLTVYGGYDDVWHALTEALTAAKSATDRADYRLRRGQLALRAGHLDIAADDLRAAESEAKQGRDEKRLARARALICDATLRQADAATADAAMGELINTARRYADTPSQQALVQARLIRYHEQFHRPEQAIAEAQTLAEKFGAVTVDGLAGQTLARQAQARLIATHGQNVYASLDLQFDKAAQGDLEATWAACERWPLAARAGDAWWRIGETLASDPAQAGRAHRALGAIRYHPQAELRRKAREQQARIEAEFPDGFCIAPRRLIKAFDVSRDLSAMLADTDGNPIRLGDRVMVAGRNLVASLDTQADDPTAALQWSMALPADSQAVRPLGQLSTDRNALMIVGHETVAGVNPQTGQPLYQRPVTDYGLTAVDRVIAGGDWVVLLDSRGRAVGVNVATGQRGWQIFLSGSDRMTLRGVSDMFLAHSTHHNVSTIYDLRTGDSLLRAPKGSRGPMLLTNDGLVLAQLSDGTLQLLDPRLEGRAIVPASAPQPSLTLLTAGRQYAVAGAEANVWRFDLADLASPIALPVPAESRAAAVALFGEQMFVLCGKDITPQNASGRDAMLAPVLAAFDPASGKPRWSASLGTPAQGSQVVFITQTGTGGIVLRVAPVADHVPPRTLWVATATGEISDVSAAASTALEVEPARLNAMVLNGRVLAEHDGQLTVLRGMNP